MNPKGDEGPEPEARMKRYSAKQIRRTLQKYALKEIELDLGKGLVLRFAEVEDAYALLERMSDQEEERQRNERFPYWAEIWPAAVGLARWFCQAELTPPTSVAVELGCGLGVVGITLAGLGWRVLATDFVEDALILTRYNAGLNQVAGQHQVSYLDWRNPVGPPQSCLVAADVVYEKKNHPYLARVLRHLLLPGGHFILSDPGRQPTHSFVEMLQAQGYEHRREGLLLTWKAREQKVDIHLFRKAPG